MTSIRGAVRGGMMTAIGLLVLACDGDEGPIGNSGAIQVTVNPATLSVQQGRSGSVTLTLTRSGGFAGAVTLAITGLPTGATATITPPQLTGATTTATVLITVALSETGTSTVTISATGTGVSAATTSVALTVTAMPDYALSLTPGALTVAAGASGSTTVNIARQNFTDGVTLELANPPAGIAGVFTPASSPSNSATLAITVAANVLPGMIPVTIRGAAPGLTDRTAVLHLTVIAAPTAGRNVEYRYCDPSSAPEFFAFQDGTGSWQAVAATTSGGATRFGFNMASARGGVLQVFRSSQERVHSARVTRRGTTSRTIRTRGSGGSALRDRLLRGPAAARLVAPLIDVYETQVLYASTTELADDGALTCALTLPTRTIRGTVAGVTAGQYAFVSLGSVTEVFDGAASTNPVTFSGVQGGLVDFFGSRLSAPGMAPNRGLMFRGLNVPDGGTLPAVIDFNSANAFVPAAATVTVAGGAGERLEVYVEVNTPTGTMLFWSELLSGTATTRPWAGLDADALLPGEFHGLIAFASPPDDADDFRVALKYVGAVGNQSITIGPAVAAATTTLVSGGAYPRYRFQGSLPGDYNRGVGLYVSSEDGGNVFSSLTTSAYLAAAGSPSSYDITMPDIAGVTGFPAAARLTPGPGIVTTDAFGFTGPGSYNPIPALGGEFKASVRLATVIVP